MSSFRIFTPTCKTDLNLCGKSITLNFTLDNDWDFFSQSEGIVFITNYNYNIDTPDLNLNIAKNITSSAKKGYFFTCGISQSSITNNTLYYRVSDTAGISGQPVSFSVNSCVVNTIIEVPSPP